MAAAGHGQEALTSRTTAAIQAAGAQVLHQAPALAATSVEAETAEAEASAQPLFLTKTEILK